MTICLDNRFKSFENAIKNAKNTKNHKNGSRPPDPKSGTFPDSVIQTTGPPQTDAGVEIGIFNRKIIVGRKINNLLAESNIN